MIVVDTDLCVDVLRGHPGAVQLLASLESTEQLSVSAITAHELWQGAYAAKDALEAAGAVERFLLAFEVLPYDEATSRLGGRLAAELASRGQAIGDLDTMIAAAALLHSASLATGNKRHFGRVPGLELRGP